MAPLFSGRWSVAGGYSVNLVSDAACQDNTQRQHTTDGSRLTTDNYFLLRDRVGFVALGEAVAAFAFITCGLISSMPADWRNS